MWKDIGQVLNIKFGEFKGLLDMRDGVGGLDEDIKDEKGKIVVDVLNKNLFIGIFYYLNRFNEFVRKFIEKFNEFYKKGWLFNG